MICVLCGEPITTEDDPIHLNPHQYVHRCCSLREVIGGIGHLLAHHWWCLIKHDPDAGLTRHQSAQMVVALIDVLGMDAVLALNDPI